MANQQSSSKGRKAPDKRPARARYWLSGGLPYRKIRALVRSGYTVEAATKVWDATRVRQKAKIYINFPKLRKLERLERTKRVSKRKPGKGGSKSRAPKGT